MGEIPHAVWSGSFNIFGVEIKCHVLENGQHIIEADSIRQLFDSKTVEPCLDAADGLKALARWVKGSAP